MCLGIYIPGWSYEVAMDCLCDLHWSETLLLARRPVQHRVQMPLSALAVLLVYNNVRIGPAQTAMSLICF